MQTTGIIRKIDELGRIVLPKELRKFLNINTGDDFQIILDNERIILEKYSLLNNYQEDINNIINSFTQVINCKIYISIKDKLINTNEQISSQLENILLERKICIEEQPIKFNITKDIIEEGKLVIMPIIVNSDLHGGIIIISSEKISDLTKISKIIYNLIKDKIE